jgi:hypothetical protein
MAKRKRRTRVQPKKRATVRGKARKPSASLRRKAAKRAGAKPARPKAKAAKKAPRKQARAVKPPNAPVAETVIVDVIEEPVPGVVTVTEFEQTEVREVSPNWDEDESEED